MNPGPLRRMVGTFGLVALAPIAWQLFNGRLDPGGAAARALAVFLVVVVVGRIASRYLDSVASSVEGDARRSLAATRRQTGAAVGGDGPQRAAEPAAEA